MNAQLEEMLKDARCSISTSNTIRGTEYLEATFVDSSGTLYADGFWSEEEAINWLTKRKKQDDKDI